MNVLEGTQEIVRLVTEQRVEPFDVPGLAGALARHRAAIVSLLGVVEEQEARLGRIEERIGETLGMGG